jgi:hypothetical protein
MKELINAVNAVMKEARSVSKNSNVGFGNSAYKGVKDIDVKQLIQPLLAKNGLALFPVSIDITTDRESWEESYSGKPKRKTQVFTEAKCKYLLVHESGQSIELQGVGYGVDAQDKGAGKAQTYALKMLLLYTFLIPVGEIDDTDTTHSNDHEVPQQKKAIKKAPEPKPVKKELTKEKTIALIAKEFANSSLSEQNQRVAASFIYDFKDDSFKRPFMEYVSNWKHEQGEILAILENAAKLDSEGLREYLKTLNENDLQF